MDVSLGSLLLPDNDGELVSFPSLRVGQSERVFGPGDDEPILDGLLVSEVELEADLDGLASLELAERIKAEEEVVKVALPG